VDLKPVTRTVWDGFVAGCPDALLFHTSDWLELLAQAYDVQWHPLGVWSGDQLLGTFPLLTRKLGPFRLAGSPLMQAIASTPFMGPLVTPAQVPPTLMALDNILHGWKVDHVEIAFPALLEDAAAAVELGYSTEVCRAVVIHLAGRTLDQVWHSLSGSCRRAVRKAESSGVEVVTARDKGFLDEYYCMCEEVYRGSGRRPHLAKEFYAAAWDALAGQGKIQVLLAMHAGKAIAGGVFLLYQDTVYYMSGASHDRGLELRPNNLIQWRFIEWAAAQGYRVYDMGGAVVPGITRFKLSFGGQFYPYTRLYRANSMRARLGRMAYQKLIPLRRRLQAWHVYRFAAVCGSARRACRAPPAPCPSPRAT
jgi:hypothetical protein